MNNQTTTGTPHDPSRLAATPNAPAQIVVKLNASERRALTTILMSMCDPRRRAPTVSEAVRAALVTTASAVRVA